MLRAPSTMSATASHRAFLKRSRPRQSGPRTAFQHSDPPACLERQRPVVQRHALASGALPSPDAELTSYEPPGDPHRVQVTSRRDQLLTRADHTGSPEADV